MVISIKTPRTAGNDMVKKKKDNVNIPLSQTIFILSHGS
jgi:hypothetical protein